MPCHVDGYHALTRYLGQHNWQNWFGACITRKHIFCLPLLQSKFRLWQEQEMSLLFICLRRPVFCSSCSPVLPNVCFTVLSVSLVHCWIIWNYFRDLTILLEEIVASWWKEGDNLRYWFKLSPVAVLSEAPGRPLPNIWIRRHVPDICFNISAAAKYTFVQHNSFYFWLRIGKQTKLWNIRFQNADCSRHLASY